jgi:phage shock protein PspC (stress-responsive transcriptional regulator)
MNNRLYRSTSDQVLGGVAAGLARTLNVDPTIVRAGFVLGTLLTQGGLLLVYLVLWAVLPTPGSTATTPGDIVRENVNEFAARLGVNRPAAPHTGAPTAPAAPAQATTPSTPAAQSFDAAGVVRVLFIVALVFLLLKVVGTGWFWAGHYHHGGSLFWPLILLLGGLWWFRRRSA